MRLTAPRVKPAQDDELDDKQKEIVDSLNEAARNLNLFRTTLKSVPSMMAMLGWSNYVGSKKTNDVPWRDKEIIILRTSFKCRSGYEWSLHEMLGKKAGLSDEEIAACRNGGEHQWDAKDSALVAMCDELVDDQFVSDATWEALSHYYGEKQMMDAVYTAAHYGMVSKFANSFGVQIDEGITLHEDLKHVG